jgi:hypothetical protein
VTIDGSFVTVKGLQVSGCSYAGIAISGDHDKVIGNVITHNIAGVNVRSGASGTRVVGNRLDRNDRMRVLTPGGSDDNGAFGVLVQGDGTEVARNRISRSDAFSYDYGRDGAAVEIYGGRGTIVHHNVALDNETFSELGNPRSGDTTYAFNVVRSSVTGGKFLVVPGAESGFGPVRGTGAYNNTVFLTGRQSQGVVCHAGCRPDILTMRNNIVGARLKAAYADGPLDEDRDLFFSGKVQLRMGPRSLVANPHFRNARRGDLHLRRRSPAIDRGARVALAAVVNRPPPRDGDGDGRAEPDLGAFEYRR